MGFYIIHSEKINYLFKGYFTFNKITKWISYIFLLSNIIPLFIYTYLGRYSRLYADDFCFYVQLKLKGFLGAFAYFYNVATGRFSDLALELATISYPNYLSTYLLIWILILSYSIHVIIRADKQYYFYSLLLSSTILVISFDLIPNTYFRRVISDTNHTWDPYPGIFEILYWRSGRNRLITPLILGTILLSLIFLINKNGVSPKKIKIWTFFGSGIAFVAGGFGETYVGVQMTLITLILIIVLLSQNEKKKKNFFLPIILFWLSTLFSIIIIIKSPSNLNRMGYFLQPSTLVELFQIIKSSIHHVFIQIFKWPSNILSGLSILFISFYIGKEIKIVGLNNASIRKLIVFPPILIAIVLVSSFFPAAYATSKAPPPRVLVTTVYIITFLFSIWFLLIGNFTKNNSPILSTKLSKIFFVLLFILFSINGFRNASKLYALNYQFRSFAIKFDQREEFINKSKKNGSKVITVSKINNFIGGTELSKDRDFWVNECICDYYGVDLKIKN